MVTTIVLCAVFAFAIARVLWRRLFSENVRQVGSDWEVTVVTRRPRWFLIGELVEVQRETYRGYYAWRRVPDGARAGLDLEERLSEVVRAEQFRRSYEKRAAAEVHR